jgi:copper chaperone CopZ
LNDILPKEHETRKIQFTVASISCVVCTPFFKKALEHVDGVKGVTQLPMMNMIVVEFDPAKVDEAKVREEIFDVAEKAGFKGKVIIPR